jgi:hypothetical protein
MTIRLGTVGQFCLSFFISGILTLLRVNPWVAMLTAIILTVSIDTAFAQMVCTTSYGVTTCSTPTSTVVCTTSYGVTTCN